MSLSSIIKDISMDPSFSQQELDSMLKAIDMRIDWLNIETERYARNMENPFLEHFKEINGSFLKKLENERTCLLQLQKRLVTEPPQITQGSKMVGGSNPGCS